MRGVHLPPPAGVCVCVWPERPVCRPGCAAGPPLCWEASGGEIPRCALAADSLPPGRFEPRPLAVARGHPRLHRRFRGIGVTWLHPVGAPLRPPARPPRSAPRLLLPGAAPWCVSLPRACRGPDPLPALPPPPPPAILSSLRPRPAPHLIPELLSAFAR